MQEIYAGYKGLALLARINIDRVVMPLALLACLLGAASIARSLLQLAPSATQSFF